MSRARRKVRCGHPHRRRLSRRRLLAHCHAVKSTPLRRLRSTPSIDFCHRLLTAEKLKKEQLARKPLKPWHDKKLHYERQGNIVDGIEQPVWTHGPIPRSIQKRTVTLERLLRNQAEVDRAGRNLIRINERPRRVDAHTIQIPGIGRINVREKIPETWDLRSTNAVEVTHRRPDVHLAEAHERTWEIHVQHRIPAPLRVTEETIADETAALASVGADGGIVHDLTTNSTETGVRHHSPSKGRETPDGEQSSEELIKASQKHRRGCRQGSRKYRRLLGQENKIRGRAIRLRDHAQTELANSIAEVHDIVAIEDLQLANMTKSAEGTSESPGANTAAKRGLNRGFAGVAPGRQAAENKAACIRRGSVYQYVHPGGTSITCSECGKNAKESGLRASKRRPREDRQTQIDGRRIDRVQLVLEPKAVPRRALLTAAQHASESRRECTAARH